MSIENTSSLDKIGQQEDAGSNIRHIRNKQAVAMLQASLAIYRLSIGDDKATPDRLMEISMYLRNNAL